MVERVAGFAPVFFPVFDARLSRLEVRRPIRAGRWRCCG